MIQILNKYFLIDKFIAAATDFESSEESSIKARVVENKFKASLVQWLGGEEPFADLKL